MELGGKDVAIVLDDAEVELTAKQIIKGAFSYSGQRSEYSHAHNHVIWQGNADSDSIVKWLLFRKFDSPTGALWGYLTIELLCKNRCTAVKLVIIVGDAPSGNEIVNRINEMVSGLTVGLPKDNCTIVPLIRKGAADFVQVMQLLVNVYKGQYFTGLHCPRCSLVLPAFHFEPLQSTGMIHAKTRSKMMKTWIRRVFFLSLRTGISSQNQRSTQDLCCSRS